MISEWESKMAATNYDRFLDVQRKGEKFQHCDTKMSAHDPVVLERKKEKKAIQSLNVGKESVLKKRLIQGSK